MWRWYLDRLSTMSWAERAWRVRNALRHAGQARAFTRGGEAAVYGKPPDPTAFLSTWRDVPWLFTPVELRGRAASAPDRDACVGEAEQILSGRYRWLGRERRVGSRPQWRKDYTSDWEFSSEFWTRIPTVDSSGRFDMKHVWELNLHGSWVTLAKAALLTGDDKYAAHLGGLWGDWLQQNPPLTGPSCTAPIETGLRLLHWGAALRLLEARRPVPQDQLQRIWNSVYYQRAFLADNVSGYSSANNHRLGELVTLQLTDMAFPGLSDEAKVIAGEQEVQKEILRQFHSDGGNKEQAFHYHAFALSLGVLSCHAARRAGRDWAVEAKARLKAAARFLEMGLDVNAQPFAYGDSDESEVLPLQQESESPHAAVVNAAAVLLERPSPFESDPRTYWLTGLHPERRHHNVESACFSECGHAFLRAGELEVHVNGGATGYLSIAAHGHDDSISVEVRYRGIRVLVDPGTFSYRGFNSWREALVAANAHNRVSSPMSARPRRLGPFMWSKHSPAALKSCIDNPPSAQGQLELAPGSRWRRKVSLIGTHEVLIEDSIEGSTTLPLRLNWVFDSAAVKSGPDSVQWKGDGVEARLAVTGLDGGGLIWGAADQPGSPCVSRGYDQLEPASAWVWEGTLNAPAEWVTRLTFMKP